MYAFEDQTSHSCDRLQVRGLREEVGYNYAATLSNLPFFYNSELAERTYGFSKNLLPRRIGAENKLSFVNPGKYLKRQNL